MPSYVYLHRDWIFSIRIILFHVIHSQETLFDFFFNHRTLYIKPKTSGKPTRTTLSSQKRRLYLHYFNRIIFAEGTKLDLVIFSLDNVNWLF